KSLLAVCFSHGFNAARSFVCFITEPSSRAVSQSPGVILRQQCLCVSLCCSFLTDFMKQTISKIYFLAAVCVVVPVVHVNSADTVSVSINSPAATNRAWLDDLVVEALEKNPELNFYRAEIAAAKGGRKAAGAWANPEVSAEIGQKRAKDSSGALLGEGTAWAVSVSQT